MKTLPDLHKMFPASGLSPTSSESLEGEDPEEDDGFEEIEFDSLSKTVVCISSRLESLCLVTATFQQRQWLKIRLSLEINLQKVC